jgi:hypothetical protein
VVNETQPLSGNDSQYSGIWYPSFTYNLNEMFINEQKYKAIAGFSTIILNIDIQETLFYIKNTQSPIAKKAEVIFRTLLFAFLCLELCAMTFLLCKLVFIPAVRAIYHVIMKRWNASKVQPFDDSC